MPPRRRLVGLIGCGRWGRNILRDLIALGCDVAVVSHSADHRHDAREQQARIVVDTLSALPSVDGFVVATPTSTHADVIESLFELDRPIFCEKPLTNDRARASHLAQRGAGRLFVMDKWRYHPAVERLAELVRQQELGRVTGLRTLRVQPGAISTDVDPVWTLAPHDLSIALELLGHLPVPRAAVAEYDGDRLVGLIGALGASPWMVLEVSARYPAHYREIRLLCEGGVAMISDADATCVRVIRQQFDPDGDTLREERLPVSNELPLLRELRAFVHHLDGGPPPRTAASEAAAIVATLATLRDLAGVD